MSGITATLDYRALSTRTCVCVCMHTLLIDEHSFYSHLLDDSVVPQTSTCI